MRGCPWVSLGVRGCPWASNRVLQGCPAQVGWLQVAPTPPSTMQCPELSAATAWAGEPTRGLAKIHPQPF